MKGGDFLRLVDEAEEGGAGGAHAGGGGAALDEEVARARAPYDGAAPAPADDAPRPAGASLRAVGAPARARSWLLLRLLVAFALGAALALAVQHALAIYGARRAAARPTSPRVAGVLASTLVPAPAAAPEPPLLVSATEHALVLDARAASLPARSSAAHAAGSGAAARRAVRPPGDGTPQADASAALAIEVRLAPVDAAGAERMDELAVITARADGHALALLSFAPLRAGALHCARARALRAARAGGGDGGGGGARGEWLSLIHI